MEKFDVSAFEKFDRQWALLTAGTKDSWNTMTISWGGLGTLWGLPVATVYVKPIRYTYEFMEKNEFFTVSFFPEAYRRDLALLGSRSGRDGDKVALTGLTPRFLENAVTFEEAESTLVCQKIYRQDLDLAQIPAEAVEHFYTEEAPHRMYIGKVLEILR